MKAPFPFFENIILMFRCHCEGGYEFTYDSTPTPLMMSEMLEKSPFVYISQVNYHSRPESLFRLENRSC